MTFRTRLFLTSVTAAALALALATAFVSLNLRRTVSERIERTLVHEARLAAETLSRHRAVPPAELDAEADAIGGLIAARVTFIAPDGRVVGDSSLTAQEVASVENHGQRPEIQQARATGLGVERRFSTTVDEDMLYVAVPVDNPQMADLAFIRLALPLVDIRSDLATVRRGAYAAFVIGLAFALAATWMTSALLATRVSSIAKVAERYASGDLSRPTRDYGNDEIGTVARVLDTSVQELGRRVEELRSDRARITAILAGMVEGVLVVNGRGRLQLVNAAARRMLQVQEDPEGMHYIEVVRHPDVSAQITAALQGQTPEGRELSLGPDGSVTLVARAAPVLLPAAHGAVLVLHDVTDLKRADRIRRDFVANVSHELRTPLTAVRGYVEALLDENEGGSNTKKFLETIARHTLRMERLVRDLLRLARLDARQERLEWAECSTTTLFSGAIAELATELTARQQTVDVHVAADATTVPGDPAKLHDIIRNLLENAIKHAPHDSRITLSAQREDNTIKLCVSDEGPGIPEPELPRIFERFYRVDKARSRDGRDPGGTGLGLSIVKNLVELHGGRVRASNLPDRGACFTVTLPA